VTSPKHAHDTNRGRYYEHPITGDRLVSVTNVLGTCVAKQALVPWAAKVAAEYAMTNLPSLVARTRTHDREELRKEISRQVTVTRDKAADLGSRIHAHAEAHVLGKPIAHDPEVDPYVKQYLRFLDDFEINITQHIEAAEMTVADPDHGYAGTGDLLAWLRLDGYTQGKVKRLDGDERRLWLIDIKSSATRPATSGYPEYVLQLAALRFAREAWLPDDTVVPMPRPIVGAAVLNLRPKSYALIPVDASKTAHAAFLGALPLVKWLHAREDFERPITPTGAIKPKQIRKTTTSRKAAA
jgi:hypothetical protein